MTGVRVALYARVSTTDKEQDPETQLRRLRAIAAAVSRTQLFKQAGNSIAVNVLEAIFRKLYLEDGTHIQRAITGYTGDIQEKRLMETR